jgi:hypothetical protein
VTPPLAWPPVPTRPPVPFPPVPVFPPELPPLAPPEPPLAPPEPPLAPPPLPLPPLPPPAGASLLAHPARLRLVAHTPTTKAAHRLGLFTISSREIQRTSAGLFRAGPDCHGATCDPSSPTPQRSAGDRRAAHGVEGSGHCVRLAVLVDAKVVDAAGDGCIGDRGDGDVRLVASEALVAAGRVPEQDVDLRVAADLQGRECEGGGRAGGRLVGDRRSAVEGRDAERSLRCRRAVYCGAGTCTPGSEALPGR